MRSFLVVAALMACTGCSLQGDSPITGADLEGWWVEAEGFISHGGHFWEFYDWYYVKSHSHPDTVLVQYDTGLTCPVDTVAHVAGSFRLMSGHTEAWFALNPAGHGRLQLFANEEEEPYLTKALRWQTTRYGATSYANRLRASKASCGLLADQPTIAP